MLTGAKDLPLLDRLIDLLDRDMDLPPEMDLAQEAEALEYISQHLELLALHSQTYNELTPLIAAVMNRSHQCSEEVFRLLIDSPTDLNAEKDCGRRAIHFLALDNHPQYLKMLLENSRMKVEVDCTTNEENMTPVYVATQCGAYQSLVVLTKIGKADVNIPNHMNQSPLHIACLLGRSQSGEQLTKIEFDDVLKFESCVRILLEAGARVNARDDGGRTPAHYLAAADVPEEVKTRVFSLLQKYGADFSLVDDEGFSPGKMAAALFSKFPDFAVNVQKNVVKTLVQYSAAKVLEINPDIIDPASDDDLTDILKKTSLGMGRIPGSK